MNAAPISPALAGTAPVARGRSVPPLPRQCRGVEIFGAGEYRGKRYTVDDLNEIVRNFSTLIQPPRPLLQPPVVIGHEEEQDLLAATDLPAAGWVSRVWRDGDILKADFDEVPESVARLINSRAYRKVSSEIYDDFEDDFGQSYGKALRRVALLGGEIPQVKRLADIPLATFSERVRLPRAALLRPCRSHLDGKARTWICFSEVNPMDPMQIKADLSAMGLDASVVEKMDDATALAVYTAMKNVGATTPAPVAAMADPPADRATLLADLTTWGEDPVALEAKTDDELKALWSTLQPTAETETPPAAAAMAEPPADRTALIAELVATGQDQASLEGMDDAALAELWRSLQPPETPAATMAEPGSREDLIAQLTTLGQDPTALASMPDADLAALLTQLQGGTPGQNSGPSTPLSDKGSVRPKKVTMTFAERQAAVNAARIRGVELRLAAQERESKRERVESFAETLLRQGKISPAERPLIVDRLVRADDRRGVRKFSDGRGKSVTLTEYQLQVRELAGRPKVYTFGEKVKARQPQPGTAASAAAQLARVRRYAESNESFKRLGRTQQFVQKFSEIQKKRPGITAAEYGVPADFAG